MAEQKTTALQLEAERAKRLLELARLQGEMLRLTRQLMIDKGLTDHKDLAVFLQHDSKAVHRYYVQNQALCSGTLLHPLTKALGREDLAQEIEQTSEGLSDKWRSLSMQPDRVVNSVLQLRQAYVKVDGRFPQERFGKFFGKHASVVEGAVNFEKDSIAALAKEQVWTEVRQVLDSVDWDTIDISEEERNSNPNIAEFRQLYEKLRQTHGPYKLKLRLGQGQDFFADLLAGRVQEKTVIKYIAKAKALLKNGTSADLPEKRQQPPNPESKPCADTPGPGAVTPLVVSESKNTAHNSLSLNDREAAARSLVSSLTSIAIALEKVCYPQLLTDGDRANALRGIQKFMVAIGLDAEAFNRLENPQSITEADTQAYHILKSLGKGRK